MTMAREEEQRRRDLIVGQLAYLLDEISALSTVLTAFPDEMLEARPFEGEPSVRDLFAELSFRETAIRIPNVERFTASEDESPALVADTDYVRPDETQGGVTADVLAEVATARSLLLKLVRAADDSVWDRTARQGEEAVTMTDYLFGVVQDDVALLRRIAQRIHESRPVGSPGFTAR